MMKLEEWRWELLLLRNNNTSWCLQRGCSRLGTEASGPRSSLSQSFRPTQARWGDPESWESRVGGAVAEAHNVFMIFALFWNFSASRMTDFWLKTRVVLCSAGCHKYFHPKLLKVASLLGAKFQKKISFPVWNIKCGFCKAPWGSHHAEN